MYDTLTGPANAEEKNFFFPEKRKHIVPTFIMFITLPTRVSLVRRETESYPNEPAALQ